MDIVMHLQVTLDRNRGGKPAEALTEFYTALFALMLQGSQANSKEKFVQVIANVRNVREGWKQVLAEIHANDAAEDGPVDAGTRSYATPASVPGRGSSWTV